MITISEYLLLRLKEFGIKHVFGVPGDYNLTFFDYIEDDQDLTWIGTSNELNGSYAADGYARIHGMSALVTTFGVGELSAINGVAGAYAEFVPVVHIVGSPSFAKQTNRSLLHHTLANGDFKIFADAYRNITAMQINLDIENAAADIDSALLKCWQEKRPVYINIPSDIVDEKIPVPTSKLDLTYPKSNQENLNKAIEFILEKIGLAQKPRLLLDLGTARHKLGEKLEALIDTTQIPFATFTMGKNTIPEDHKYFIGFYHGDFGTPGVQQDIESADCILHFSPLMSDLNTGNFTCNLPIDCTIEIQLNYVKHKNTVYYNVMHNDLINALQEKLVNYKYNNGFTKFVKSHNIGTLTSNNPIKQEIFWKRVENLLEENGIVIAETGSSTFGTYTMPMPKGTTYINQTLWGSIGYSVGALLGAACADPNRQCILFVGDGSFQLTAQAISTVIRNNLTPIVFLLNNKGYTIERVIHGAKRHYNDVQNWNYANLPKIFGDNVWSTKVSSEQELEQALQSLSHHSDKLRFIEIELEPMDLPKMLQ